MPDGALVTSQAAWLVPVLALVALPTPAGLLAAAVARASIQGGVRVLGPVLERLGLPDLLLLYGFVLIALVAQVARRLGAPSAPLTRSGESI